MNRKTIEYAAIKSAINILCVLCAANSSMVIDALTGILWDEEEAGDIKRSSGKPEYSLSATEKEVMEEAYLKSSVSVDEDPADKQKAQVRKALEGKMP